MGGFLVQDIGLEAFLPPGVPMTREGITEAINSTIIAPTLSVFGSALKAKAALTDLRRKSKDLLKITINDDLPYCVEVLHHAAGLRERRKYIIDMLGSWDKNPGQAVMLLRGYHHVAQPFSHARGFSDACTSLLRNGTLPYFAVESYKQAQGFATRGYGVIFYEPVLKSLGIMPDV
jgi:hypothetical protein